MTINASDELKKKYEMLGLDVDRDYENHLIKKQYHKMALLHHPDKNPAPEATQKFKDLQNAYEEILVHQGWMDVDDEVDVDVDVDDVCKPEGGIYARWMSYRDAYRDAYCDAYREFLQPLLEPLLNNEVLKEAIQKVVYKILDKLSEKCEEKAIQMFERLDGPLRIKIYQLLVTQRDVLHIPPSFLSKIYHSYQSEIQNRRCILIRPTLDNLFHQMVYKYTEEGQLYMIPLWHHEIVYDHNGCDLYFQCLPELPDNVEIDEHNNILVSVKHSLEEIWKLPRLDVHLGQTTFSFEKHQLKMKERQVLSFIGCGIPRIDTQNIYNVSKKSNVYVHLTIV